MTRHVEQQDELKLTNDEWQMIRAAFQGLAFGTVVLTLQDGVVVQLDRLDKRRVRGGEKALHRLHPSNSRENPRRGR